MRVIRLLLVLFICAVPAAADTIYQVTGSATITGNNNCGGPCVETVDFSFLVSYTFVEHWTYPVVQDFYAEHLVSLISLSSTGPLAPFTTLGATNTDFFILFNANHDEIDLNGPFGDAELAPRGFPDLVDSELYGCGGGQPGASPVCVADFGMPGATIAFGHVVGGTIQTTVTTVNTPEPGILVLLSCGVLFALAMYIYRRRSIPCIRLPIVAVFLLSFLFLNAPAKADTIYRVDGATTFTGVAGNNNCNGPCIETVAFSFLVSYTPFFGGSFFQANVRSVLSLVSIGPLPPFTSLGPSSTGDFFGLGNSEGDELDLVGPNGENSPPTRPFPVLLPFSDFYGCSSVATAADSVCVRDFALPGLTFGHIGGGPLEYTVTTVATPEGSTRLYLLAGAALGLLGMLARTQKYCSGLPPG